MPSEIDEIMNTDPLQLSEKQLWQHIAYHRDLRARIEAGGKVKKSQEATEKLIVKPILPRPEFKRRV